MKKIVLLFLAANYALAGSTGFLHPTGFDAGAQNRHGTTPANAIDRGVGDCGGGSSFWAFVSALGGGADFYFQFNNSIRTTRISIQSCSTGFKDFVAKKADGNYDTAYGLGNAGPNTGGGGTLQGNFIQPDGRVVIGVRNRKADVEHHLNDIAFEIEYEPLNSPPSAPQITTPLPNQTADSGVNITWTASQDPDNDTLSYFLQYSSDSVSWTNITTAECCEHGWNGTGELVEGTAFVSAKAFDGRQYGEASVVLINIKHAFYSSPEQQDAFAGEAVEWRAGVSGSGLRNCAYALPADALRVEIRDSANNTIEFQNYSNTIRWACNLAAGNQTIYYYTQAVVVLNETPWAQNPETQSTARTQFLSGIEKVANPSSHDYERIRALAICPQNFSCAPSEIEIPFLSSGGEFNSTILAEGDGISETESEEQDENGYNKTILAENSLPALYNVSFETAIPQNLVGVTAFAVHNNTREEVGSLNASGGKASFSLAMLWEGTTEIKISGEFELQQANCTGAECGNCAGNCTQQETQENTRPSATPAPSPAPEAANTPAPTPAPSIGPNQALSEAFHESLNESASRATPSRKPGKITALATAKDGRHYAIPTALLLVSLAIAGHYKFFRKRISICRKTSESGRVELKVKSSLLLESARLTQMVPENSAHSFSPQPKIRETVTGDLLEWDLGEISGNAVVEFECGEKLKPAILEAKTQDGKTIIVAG